MPRANCRWELVQWRAKRLWYRANSYFTMRKHIKGYSSAVTAKECADTWLEINRCLASGDLRALDDLVTESALKDYRPTCKKMAASPNTHVYKFEGWATPPRLCQTLCFPITPDMKHYMAQATMRLNARQSLETYDRTGKLLKASEPTVEEVYLLFERGITYDAGRWRLAARLA